ncbi:MAG TPA: hypothetical protein VKR06_12055 [Ktedonosporobacter sp.]|nr:hypothetical protein [Ktedonosporobacter sp.]
MPKRGDVVLACSALPASRGWAKEPTLPPEKGSGRPVLSRMESRLV